MDVALAGNPSRVSASVDDGTLRVMGRPKCVAVVGPGLGASLQDCSAARVAGRLLAEQGFSIVCGGLGGVMEAVAEGASQAGGLVVGILPGLDRESGNQFLGVALPTGLGELRNGLIIRSCDGVIAIGGSWGTLSEVALARRTGLPLVSVGGWTVIDSAGEEVPIEVADTPEAAVARIAVLIGETAAD